MAYIRYISVYGLLWNGSRGKGSIYVCSKACATLHRGGFSGLLQRQRTQGGGVQAGLLNVCTGWYMARGSTVPCRRSLLVRGGGWFNLCTLIVQRVTGVQPPAGSAPPPLSHTVLHLPGFRLEPAHQKREQHWQRCDNKAIIMTTKKMTRWWWWLFEKEEPAS